MIIDPRVTQLDHVDDIRAEIDRLRDEIGETDEIARETLAELRQWIEWDLRTKVLLDGRRYGEVMVELGRMDQEELDAIEAEDPAEVDREIEETLRELDLLVEEEDLPFGSL